MNLLALSLVLTSLLTAQVWSPSPTGKHQNQKEEDVIVKEGHRVIVVETFDDEGGQHNTKIRISPPQDSISSVGVIENAKEKVKQAAHVLPNLGQGLSSSGYGPDSGSYQDKITTGPGELICDAFGKCRHKIAKVIDKAKEKVEDAYGGATHQTKEIIHEAKEIAQEGIIRKKRIAHEAKDKVEDACEKTKETVSHKAHEAKEVVEDAYEKAKDSGTQKAQEVKESAKESLDKAKDIAKDAKDLGKTIGVDSVKNVSEKTGQATNIVYNSLNRAFRFMGSQKGIHFLMGVINLLGFSIAYGMCFWVTFISSYVLANALNRQQFGLVQSKIYPVYFRAMGFCIAVALFGHLIGRMKFSFTSKAEVFQAINLLLSVLLVLINALYLEPLATKVMFDKLKIEKEEGRGRETSTTESNRAEQEPVADASPATALGSTATTTGSSAPTKVPENRKEEEIRSRIVRVNERLKKLNSCSSFLNILILMALTWHLVYLGQWLHGTC
ncbi:hypothetical protein JCGZ_10947 [Jatropha curcas]|uniref:TMEM205-like domain-containing protein n=2 Tax=Jatropha curcas TaxID=180498 RepID=A0A067KS45_JATCU|nr:hypothetical protein JCGZ_10947 [Jatropha curcas]